MKRDKPPHAIIRKTAKGFSPVGSYDAEIVWALPLGSEFDLIPRSKRSNQQLRLYWSMCHRVVDATDIAPTAEHLSEMIKLTLGYTRQLENLKTGKTETTVDSLALDKMDNETFRKYFDDAQKLLAEKLQFDPLAFLETA